MHFKYIQYTVAYRKNAYLIVQNSYKLVQTRSNVEQLPWDGVHVEETHTKSHYSCANMPKMSQWCRGKPLQIFWQLTTRGYPRRFVASFNSPYIAAYRQ